MILDHLVVGAQTLAEARAHVQDALGLPMQDGGQHAIFHTHNALMGFDDGLYLEAIAPDPTRPTPERPRWFDLDRFVGPARLSNWVVAVPDLAASLADMPDGCGTPVAVHRGDLKWEMAVSPMGTTPFDNLWPPVISWPADVQHPATRLQPTGARLLRLTLTHPQGAALGAQLARFLTDDRLAIETGPIGLRAAFQTRHGVRWL